MCNHEKIKSFNTPRGVQVTCDDCGKSMTSASDDHEKALHQFTQVSQKNEMKHNVHGIDFLSEDGFNVRP